MNRPQIVILLPCHGLEDFPTDLGESDAAGLLNAFSAAYHPALLAATRELPSYRRGDDVPGDPAGKIVIVPPPSVSWLPHGWGQKARESGAAVVEGISERGELVGALLGALESFGGTPVADAPGSVIDENLVADFLAFGTAILLVDVLTRRMHYYSNLDGGPVRSEVVGAAEAALAGDAEQARRRLSRAFEALLEARERFFPVDAYLLDLCLVIPRLAEKIPAGLSPLEPTTLLGTAADWEQIATERPELIDRLKLDWEARRLCLAGGEYREGPTSLLPVESVLWEFDRGLAAYRRVFGRTPKVWARRRYGFSTLLPQILDRCGIHAAVHAALDDGLYPDEEWSKFRWDGCDGVGVDAFSRIPLAADSATSYLRFPSRMAESMEHDSAAAVMFARWPEVSVPWWDDLRRINRYAPVFGKFVTLETFFEDTDPATRVRQHESKGYFPPYLTQAVAGREADPISQFGRRVERRHRFDAAIWMETIAGLLRGDVGWALAHHSGPDTAGAVGQGPPYVARQEPRPPESATETGPPSVGDLEDRLGTDGLSELDDLSRTAAGELARAILTGAPAGRGTLILNPLSFPRRVSVEWPAGVSAPGVEGPVKYVQFDARHRHVTLDLPAAGFVWLPASGGTAPRKSDAPTAEEAVLRNEFFEVHVNEETGGIGYIKGYGRSPKRLSQQLAFRFPRKRTVRQGEWGDDQTYYSAMRGRSLELTCTGPSLAEAVTTGDLIDQTNGEVLAAFRQVFRVWRGRNVVELEIELEPKRLPEGDPWTNYYACRFAWNDETAVVTRSVQGTAQPSPDGRLDAPHYVEIAEDELRTTIVPVGLPFHRRTENRMLDTLLVVAGETARKFRFVIACDEAYPMRAALDAYVPPVVLPTEVGPPPAGPAGWFLHVDTKNVQVTSLRPLPPAAGQPGGVQVRLAETEGRAKATRLTFFKTPSSARLVNLVGETIGNLAVAGGSVTVELHKYEIATVELRF
jgi:alpha-mannosidase